MRRVTPWSHDYLFAGVEAVLGVVEGAPRYTDCFVASVERSHGAASVVYSSWTRSDGRTYPM